MKLHGTLRGVAFVEERRCHERMGMATPGSQKAGRRSAHLRISKCGPAAASGCVRAPAATSWILRSLVKTAIIEAIEQDYEGKFHLGVVVDDDPGSDIGLMRQPGHRFFFTAEEVEPLLPGDDDKTQPDRTAHAFWSPESAIFFWAMTLSEWK